MCVGGGGRGGVGDAIVLGKLPVPGRPTNLDYNRARAYCDWLVRCLVIRGSAGGFNLLRYSSGIVLHPGVIYLCQNRFLSSPHL